MSRHSFSQAAASAELTGDGAANGARTIVFDPATIIVVTALVALSVSGYRDWLDGKRKRAGPPVITLTGGLEHPRPNEQRISAEQPGERKPGQ